MIFKTQWNANETLGDIVDTNTGEVTRLMHEGAPALRFPRKYETTDKPSMTIPDQALTIVQILDRYARGLPLGGEKVPMYDSEGDVDMHDFQLMDEPDRIQYMMDMRDELQELKTKIAHDKKLEAEEKAQSRTKSQRTTAQEINYEQTDAQPAEGASQHPKKTRGAGAEPRNEAKGGTE